MQNAMIGVAVVLSIICSLRLLLWVLFDEGLLDTSIYIEFEDVQMTEDREHIPETLRRKVLVEAGHRCAIPTCRTPEVDIHHIIPYNQVKKHEYENLIALCPNCHKRAGTEEIDRKSLRIYKRILQRLTDRYERFELNVLNELRLEKRVIYVF